MARVISSSTAKSQVPLPKASAPVSVPVPVDVFKDVYSEDDRVIVETTARGKRISLAEDIGGGGGGGEIILLAATARTQAVGFEVVAAASMGPLESGTVYTLIATMQATAGMTAELRLYNVTSGSSVTLLSSTSVAVPEDKTVDLTVGTDLAASRAMYELQLRISAGSPGDLSRAIVHHATLALKD